jgi:hypothetical protein
MSREGHSSTDTFRSCESVQEKLVGCSLRTPHTAEDGHTRHARTPTACSSDVNTLHTTPQPATINCNESGRCPAAQLWFVAWEHIPSAGPHGLHRTTAEPWAGVWPVGPCPHTATYVASTTPPTGPHIHCHCLKGLCLALDTQLWTGQMGVWTAGKLHECFCWCCYCCCCCCYYQPILLMY